MKTRKILYDNIIKNINKSRKNISNNNNLSKSFLQKLIEKLM